MSLVFRNPILKREIEHRMRDKRTFYIPTVYLSLLGLVIGTLYFISTRDAAPMSPTPGYTVGSAIFSITVVLQLFLVILLVPSLSGAAITSERDCGCLVPLLVTPISRMAVTLGKLVAPILYIFFLLSLSLPFAALSFGFGGTDLALLVSAYMCIAACALLLASVGLFISTLFKRTVPSVLLSYASTAFLFIGTLVADGLREAVGQSESWFFLYLNPFFALLVLLSSSMTFANPVYWWISPLVQTGLSLVLIFFAGIRISKMRE